MKFNLGDRVYWVAHEMPADTRSALVVSVKTGRVMSAYFRRILVDVRDDTRDDTWAGGRYAFLDVDDEQVFTESADADTWAFGLALRTIARMTLSHATVEIRGHKITFHKPEWFKETPQ